MSPSHKPPLGAPTPAARAAPESASHGVDHFSADSETALHGKDVLSLMEELRRRIAHERPAVIERIQRDIQIFRIRPAELGYTMKDFKNNQNYNPADAAAAAAGLEPDGRRTVAAKYRGPAGQIWSGRGKTPVWLREEIARGAKPESFLIQPEGEAP